MASQQIDIADIERLTRAESPDLAAVITAFLQQPDPTHEQPLPAGAMTMAQFLAQLNYARSPAYDKHKRRAEVTALWKKYLAQSEPDAPPRLQLADLLVRLYEAGTEPARDALVEIVRTAPLAYGLWGGLKRVYKLAEARHDARLFGALAWRFDTAFSTYDARREASPGTLVYLRRRAWRYLKELAQALPEVYPQFAVEVLRHYTEGYGFYGSWIANHIWAHGSKRFSAKSYTGRLPTDLVKQRAFDALWKVSPEPLMYLLETCLADMPARFAIQSLRKDFPDTLRKVEPAWLVRLARRPLAGVHEFLVETLQASAEFHQAKLKGLGLHDTVLSLLYSPSPKARTYAIEYARAHAPDLPAEQLALLLNAAFDDTKKFAAEQLKARDPRALGAPFLGGLLAYREVGEWAKAALTKSFERNELTNEFLTELFYGNDAQRSFVLHWCETKYQPGELEASFWTRLLDDPRAKNGGAAPGAAMQRLEKYPAAELTAAWLLDALTREHINQAAARILRKADKLPGLDIERVKGLVFNAGLRDLALEVLGNKKLVKPRDLTLPWLLALARRPDPSLHAFAHRYLLENMRPEDFSEGDAKDAGVVRLFALATGDKEPDPVRAFAQTYLRCHHPVLGPEQPEAKSLGLKPHLKREAYTAERLWPALFDHRGDVKKFAALLAKAELRRWGYLPRVYELSDVDLREVRLLCYDALLKAGEEGADEACTFKPDEIDAAKVFALTESRKRTTREVALELIRKQYQKLGGPERLGWLMESPDREVRTFAVQLLWEKHRPRALPRDWKPKGRFAAPIDDAGRFADIDALRGFLRSILFGLPPGRNPEPGELASARKPLSASVAKRNVIEIVRDLGVDDEAFARVAAPVLHEFAGSMAKGEWQACLSALARLRGAHPQAISFGGEA